MGVYSFDELLKHVGHKIVCVAYGEGRNPEQTINVAIECETCNEIIVDYDKG